MIATWKGRVIASSDKVEELDGNIYFPINSLKKQYFVQSTTSSSCPYKGKANYLHIKIDGLMNEDAAWYYSHPTTFAHVLKDKVAFWKGVEIKNEYSGRTLNFKNIISIFF